MSDQNRVYNIVDYMEFVFAVCIVLHHTEMLSVLFSGGGYYYVRKAIFCVAVPFFFVTTGFFLCNSMVAKGMEHAIVGYIKRLLVPLLFWETVNVCLEVYKQVAIPHTSLKQVIRDVVLHILFYPYGALWFMQACIVGACVLLLFYRIKANRSVVILIALICHIIGLVTNRYFFLVENTCLANVVRLYRRYFISGRNGIFVGFPYLLIGIGVYLLWRRYGEKLRLKALILIAAVVYGMYVLEIVAVQDFSFVDDESQYVIQPLLASTLLLIALKAQTLVQQKTLDSSLYRNLSVGIYYTHRPLISVFQIAFFYLGIESNSFITGALVLALSLGGCIFVYRNKTKPLYSLLR